MILTNSKPSQFNGARFAYTPSHSVGLSGAGSNVFLGLSSDFSSSLCLKLSSICHKFRWKLKQFLQLFRRSGLILSIFMGAIPFSLRKLANCWYMISRFFKLSSSGAFETSSWTCDHLMWASAKVGFLECVVSVTR